MPPAPCRVPGPHNGVTLPHAPTFNHQLVLSSSLTPSLPMQPACVLCGFGGGRDGCWLPGKTVTRGKRRGAVCGYMSAEGGGGGGGPEGAATEDGNRRAGVQLMT